MEGQKIHISVYDYLSVNPKYCPKAVVPTRAFWDWEIVKSGNTWVENDILRRMVEITKSLARALDENKEFQQEHFIELECEVRKGELHVVVILLCDVDLDTMFGQT